MAGKSNKTGFVLFALLCCWFVLACIGCNKTGDSQSKTIEFEIDRDYQRGPLTAHVRIDKSEINIAQTITLELEATIEPGYEVQMPGIEDALENFGIIDWDNLGDKLDENDNVVSTYRYRLEPFLSGTFALPGFTFRFHDVNNPDENKYELTTEPVEIKVASLLGQDRENLTIADIEGVVALPEEASFLWVWILCFTIIVILAGGVWFFVRRRRTEELVRIYRPAHEIAYARLRALIKKDLVGKGKIKEFHEGLSDILRHYIEHRFELRAPERTTEEFLAELQYTNVLSEPQKEQIGEFLNHCDLVKFAKYYPSNEQIQIMFNLVKEFIEKTKSEQKKIDVTETEKIAELRSA